MTKDVGYPNAHLTITGSVVPETAVLRVDLPMDGKDEVGLVEISVSETGNHAEDWDCVQLNRQNIEILVDFLSGWLDRTG